MEGKEHSVMENTRTGLRERREPSEERSIRKWEYEDWPQREQEGISREGTFGNGKDRVGIRTEGGRG
jgi:hypothetical protein